MCIGAAHDARGEASTLFDAGRQWSGGHPGQQGQPHYSSGQQIGKPGGIGDRRGGSYNGSRSSGKATQAAPDERGGTNSRKDRSHPHDRRRANRSRSPSRSPSRSQSRSPSRERRGHPQSQPRPTARKWGHEQARPANERWHSGGAPSSPIANGAAFVQQAQQVGALLYVKVSSPRVEPAASAPRSGGRLKSYQHANACGWLSVLPRRLGRHVPSKLCASWISADLLLGGQAGSRATAATRGAGGA